MRKKIIAWRIGISIIFVLVLGLIVYSFVIRNRAQLQNGEIRIYEKHYAFVSDLNYQGTMWEEIYTGARAYGETHDILVEWFGENLVEDYSKRELLKIAIESGVDGIIVQGDDSGEMNDLVNEAESRGIPVITVWQDSYGSYRKSFVGMSSYNLGREYGEYLLQMEKNSVKKLLVVINTGNEDSGEKLVYTGIRETLADISGEEIKVDTLVVDGSERYGVEESIRTLLLGDEIPDVVVCLDEQTTSTMIRLMVDYNKVGQARVIGFYDSDEILDAVESNAIMATLSSDCYKMGNDAVSILDEYSRKGYVSEYMPVEVQVITRDNVNAYRMSEEESDDE